MTHIPGSVYSLQLDHNDSSPSPSSFPVGDVLYMLNSNGVIATMHLQQQKVTGSVVLREEPQAAVEGESYNAMCWLGDSSYLILFHGALYSWDSLTSRTLFCQYIPCHATNAALRAVTHVRVGPSLVVLAYA